MRHPPAFPLAGAGLAPGPAAGACGKEPTGHEERPPSPSEARQSRAVGITDGGVAAGSPRTVRAQASPRPVPFVPDPGR